MTVVDASVATKWFLIKEFSEESLSLTRMDHKMVAPELARFEVSGAIIRALRKKEIDAAEASDRLQEWLHAVRMSVVRLDHEDQDILRGAELAAEIGHPLKDCIYLAMAERLDVALVTADKTFYDNASPNHTRVVFITDVSRLAA